MSAQENYLVGVGRAEITPPLSVPYLGGFPRHTSFEGVHDPLFVRSIVVSDGRNVFCWVLADSIGFARGLLGEGRDFIGEVRSRVSERTGIPAECVMVSASHIHSTPDTICLRPLGDSAETVAWLEGLVERIAESVSCAAGHQFDARLKVCSTNLEGISRNRNNDSHLDTEMIVLLFESVDGDDRVVLVNCACHPVIMQVQSQVSADFVGVVQSNVENLVSGVRGCLFIQGACGDVNPACGDTRDFRDCEKLGLTIAGEVAKLCVVMSATSYPAQAVGISVVSDAIGIPSRPMPGKDEVIGHIKNTECLNGWEDEETLPPADALVSAEVLQRVSEGCEPFDAEIQLARIGGVLIIGIPFELFSRIGSEIKQMASPLVGIPAGYTNGYLGYVAPPEYWKDASVYEVQCGPWSKVGPDAYSLIMDAVKALSAGVVMGGN